MESGIYKTPLKRKRANTKPPSPQNATELLRRGNITHAQPFHAQEVKSGDSMLQVVQPASEKKEAITATVEAPALPDNHEGQELHLDTPTNIVEIMHGLIGNNTLKIEGKVSPARLSAAFEALKSWISDFHHVDTFKSLLGPKVMQNARGLVIISTAYCEVAKEALASASTEQEREDAKADVEIAELDLNIVSYHENQLRSAANAFYRQQGAICHSIDVDDEPRSIATFQKYTTIFSEQIDKLPMSVKKAHDDAAHQALFTKEALIAKSVLRRRYVKQSVQGAVSSNLRLQQHLHAIRSDLDKLEKQ